MSTTLQIKCITKSDRHNPHERILAVGGDGWKWTQEHAIDAIRFRGVKLYVLQAGRQVDVIIAKSAWGNLYLKTASDGLNDNNLLSLPQCL